MGIAQAISEFANDKQLQVVLILIVVDTILGIIAAVVKGEFAFSKVSGFLKDDVLGKVVPWFTVFAAAKFAPDVELGSGVATIDLNQIQTLFWGYIMIALVASLTSSASDLGLGLPRSLATGENEGATPKPSG